MPLSIFAPSLLQITLYPFASSADAIRLFVVVFPFVPQVTIIPFDTHFSKPFTRSGHILSAYAPGEEDDFLPNIFPTMVRSFPSHIARSFLITVIPFKSYNI